MSDLTISRAEATDRISAQISKGEDLLNERIESSGQLKAARHRFYTWDEYTEELLRRIFTTPDEAESFRSFGAMVVRPTTFGEDVEEHRDDVRSKLRRLGSLLERLELFDEPSAAAAPDSDSQEAIARRLLDTLARVRDSNFQDTNLIQEAKILNARLGPTYIPMYGAIPEITTTYPAYVWFPRATEYAEQALAIASAGQVAPSSRPALTVRSDRVFVVHGHDHGLMEAVARLIDRLGYKPVILHERPDRGQTIIEKFEGESPDAAFAVILLTPDDEGRLRAIGEEAGPLVPRARQNVVWEFGYFTALLGRGNVVALVVGADELERPSDLDGLLYVPVREIDDQNWRTKLAREMRAAGLEIDLNKAE